MVLENLPYIPSLLMPTSPSLEALAEGLIMACGAAAAELLIVGADSVVEGRRKTNTVKSRGTRFIMALGKAKKMGSDC